jgi:hypothetical protein
MTATNDEAQPDSFAFDYEAEDRTAHLREAAITFREMAVKAMELAELLDDSAERCKCCGTIRFRNFQQKQLRDRVCGASERLDEIANTIERRARERAFLGLPPIPQGTSAT